jgi:MYXO-CTERM domain-containing protein
MVDPWDEEPDESPHGDRPPPAAYSVPEATMAGDPSFLAALAAAILGVLLFWRRKKPEDGG